MEGFVLALNSGKGDEDAAVVFFKYLDTLEDQCVVHRDFRVSLEVFLKVARFEGENFYVGNFHKKEAGLIPISSRRNTHSLLKWTLAGPSHPDSLKAASDTFNIELTGLTFSEDLTGPVLEPSNRVWAPPNIDYFQYLIRRIK